MGYWYFLMLITICSVIYFNKEVKAECGGFIEASFGTITSPRYPDYYPPNLNCTWEIKIPPNKNIWLYVKYFFLSDTDYVSFTTKKKDGSFREPQKYSRKQINESLFYYHKATILQMEFKSDEKLEKKGFELYFFTECGRLIEETNGTITSPFYPDLIPFNDTCIWKIKIPPNKSIWLHFKDFRLEYRDVNCSSDFLILKSKMEDGSVREHRNYCGSEVHKEYFYFNDTSNLEIDFKWDRRRSFELDFFTVPFECGRMLEGSEGIITSPRYPLAYPPDLHCTWTIQAPLKHFIKLNFTDFKTQNSIECDEDHITVRSKMADGEVREHGTFCGGETPPVIDSESNRLEIQFLSRTNNGHQGFKATFISEGCGGMIEGHKGNINSPFFPDPYPPNKICEWSFLVPPQHKLKLNFLHFEIEGGGDDCSNDFLLIQSKTAEGEIQELGKYCGESRLQVSYSKDNILLTFVSDRSVQRKGFKAEYTIDKLTDYEMSTMLMKSTTPAHAPKRSTTENQNNIIEIEKASSRNDTNIF